MTEGNPRLAEPRDPIRGAYDDEDMPHQGARALVATGGPSNMEVKGGVITAQRCDVKRDINAVHQNLKVLAQMNGDAYVYRIPFKNKRKGTTEIVKGPTIKLAQDLAREWGNCEIDCRVEEHADHFMMYARFIDYERGYSHTRPFKQRKAQDTGMSDRGRAEDLILQIGASKAIRNVIVAVLGSFAQFMQEEAEGSVLGRITKAPDKARDFIIASLASLEVPVNRVERIMGRKAKDWKPTDMAKIYGQLSAIKDNMVDPDDVWPENADAAEDVAGAERKSVDGDGADEAREDEGTTEDEKSEDPAPKSKNVEKPAEQPKKAQPKKKAAPPPPEPEPEPEEEPEDEEDRAGADDDEESELDGFE